MAAENTISNMPNGSVQLPEGFILRTKEGKLKIVKSGELVDVRPRESRESSQASRYAEPATPSTSIPVPPPPKPASPPAQPSAAAVPQAPRPEVPKLEHVAPAPMQMRPIPLVQPQAPIAPTTKPAYFVEPEDEADILRHREKVSAMGTESNTGAELDQTIKGIIQKNALTFPDDVMEKRFMNIARSRLMEMRNSIETEDALERSQKIGGMGFESGLVRRVMVDIEEAAATIASKGELKKIRDALSKASVPEKAKPYAPHIPLKPPVSAERREIPEIPGGKSFVPSPPVLPRVSPGPMQAPPPPSPQVRAPQAIPVVSDTSHEKDLDVSSRVTTVPSAPVRQAAPMGEPMQAPVIPHPTPVIQRFTQARQPRQTMQTGRPTVSDIIQAPVKKTLGPVDELAELTVTDFRRLGSTAREMKEKVLEKIELLEEESFSMRSAGIKAWRRSPVFQKYLAMGRQSIEQGASVQNIIAQQASAEPSSLTYEEFEAIADLNRSLRY